MKTYKKNVASIGEPTSQVISIPTSSEVEKYQRDTGDYEQVAVKEEETDYETDKQIEACGLNETDDGLYDEMLNISKQLLSMNIINQEYY